MRFNSALAVALLVGVPLSILGMGAASCGSSNPSSDVDSGTIESGPPVFNVDGGPECIGLCPKQVKCPGGGKTTISGTVWDPGGNVKLYNVVVYVPNAPVLAITNGATCDKCAGGTLSGDPLVATLTDASGQFSLENVPVVDDMPLVIQVGKWRRQIVVPKITACADTPLLDKNQTRLPKNATEGDIPLIALTTGGADTLECLLGKNKIGLDDSVFSKAGGPGRVHLYQGKGSGGNPTTKFAGALADGGADGGSSLALAETLWSTPANLQKYDIVLLSCEGDTFAAEKPAAALDAMKSYTTNGGRVFASHWHNYWFTQRFASTGPWIDRLSPPNPSVATIDTSFPKGVALRDWLVSNGSKTPGTVSISEPRHNLDAPVTAGQAQGWLTMPNPLDAGTIIATEYMSFNTPLGVPEKQQCGRAVFSDLHVGSDTPGLDYPLGCTSVGLTEQEKILEFMLFDLSACISDDRTPPPPPK